ncbi:hypothetical protein CH373_14335 [Leptospira perolatii]|uniref:Lipoprotein n=1 Tax=Leptospira perolatii TaxID=2023191 RepID=A0A2M9ZJU6_9LEPT|nr:hypothetical protein CH360_12285 [Leptospira perolatii]PJZ72336.1 hypothetical protein CH373_14335 [Leptospira perolatii]
MKKRPKQFSITFLLPLLFIVNCSFWVYPEYGVRVPVADGVEALNLNLIYGKSHTIAGVSVGGFNESDSLYGAKVGVINFSKESYGVTVGLHNIAERAVGIHVGLLNETGKLKSEKTPEKETRGYGLKVAVANIGTDEYSLNIGLANLGKLGVSIGAVNMGSFLQIGLINSCFEDQKSLIGLRHFVLFNLCLDK